MGMERHKVILDVDTGTGLPVCDIDDGIAIALALASPEIELLGCTTCGGNVRTHESTINTLRILEMAGRGDIPVAEGRANPFRQDVSASFAWLEQRSAGGRDFWYKDMPPLLEPTLSPSPLKAHEFIIEMVKKHPGEVTIVKEGSLTNLALAVLVEPEIAPLVKEVVHMGGHVGNRDWERVGPAALPPVLWRDILRMNTEFDPEATAIVIESGIPFTFVTGTSSWRTRLARGSNGTVWSGWGAQVPACGTRSPWQLSSTQRSATLLRYASTPSASCLGRTLVSM